MTHYIYAHRRPLELAISLIGAFYGLGQYFEITLGYGDPFYWLGLDVSDQALLSLMIGFFSLVHIAGVSLNGEFKYSPFMRAFGIFGHATATTFIALTTLGAASQTGHGIPSGFWLYTPFAALLWYVGAQAAIDYFRIKKVRDERSKQIC